MDRKAVIFGIKGLKLNYEEIKFLKKSKPWGIILFSRNIKSLLQLRNLTSSIKKIFNDQNYPILIDQEGGRVSRLNKIFDLSMFPQYYFGNLYKKDFKYFKNYYKIYINGVSDLIKSAGININTAPVLDVLRKKTHKIIGNRSFSEDPKIVSAIGDLCIKLYSRNKIATVVKHIPGHGLSLSDSHSHLPTVVEKKKNLIKNDFKTFKKCKSFFAMTAHVIYKKYDFHNTATHSNIIINDVIRKHIGFDGLIITDDISMKALKYSLSINSIKALNAGCNLILHCNGNIKEMHELSNIVPQIDKFIKKKTSQFYNFLR